MKDRQTKKIDEEEIAKTLMSLNMRKQTLIAVIILISQILVAFKGVIKISTVSLSPLSNKCNACEGLNFSSDN